MIPAQTERQLQRQVTEYLEIALRPYGAFVTAIPGGDLQMTRCPGYRAGTPDVLIVIGGRAVWIELKTPRGRLSNSQRVAHTDIGRAGAAVHVARSLADVEDIVRALKEGEWS